MSRNVVRNTYLKGLDLIFMIIPRNRSKELENQ